MIINPTAVGLRPVSGSGQSGATIIASSLTCISDSIVDFPAICIQYFSKSGHYKRSCISQERNLYTSTTSCQGREALTLPFLFPRAIHFGSIDEFGVALRGGCTVME